MTLYSTTKSDSIHAKQAERRELAARFLQARIQHYGYEAIKVSEIETVIDTTLLLADTLIRKTS